MTPPNDPHSRRDEAAANVPSPAPVEQPEASNQPELRLGQKIWFAFKAAEIRLRFILLLVVMMIVIGNAETIRNYWDKWTRPAASELATLGGGMEFYCPMHPSVVRDTLDPSGAVPSCPICGMPLSKRQKGAPSELPPGVVGRVQLSPERVRLAGIRTAEVDLRPLTRQIRTVGYVAYDESRRSRVVARFGGYLEKLYVNTTFAHVQEGQALAEIYSPQLYVAAQELLIAQRSNDRRLIASSRDKLRLLEIDDREIDEILRTGQAERRLLLRSPRSGHVIRKEVVEGSSIEAGQTLFEVADLSVVWIEADVYEKDVSLVQVGQAVEATVEAFPNQVFRGHVALVYPEVNVETRTNRVRFEIVNPELHLRPGMYAMVQLSTPMQQVEPFRTQLVQRQEALRSADRETLVSIQKLCPVTGAKLGSMGEPIPHEVQGRTVYLCCSGCTEEMNEQPEHFLTRVQTVTEDGVLAVPAGAVIDTGDQQIVYVERESGVFEGVEVKLGARTNGYFPVVEGLLPGDRVAAAGAFLIDAETRLNPAASASYFGASGSPSSAGSAGSMGSTTHRQQESRSSQSSGSNSSAANQIEQNLAKLSSEDQQLARQQQTCPITGAKLGSMGVPVKIDLQGTPVFLCCEGCIDAARRNPSKTLERLAQ